MREDKQKICDLLCETLRATSNAGDPLGNPLVELRYIKDPPDKPEFKEIVRPIFADGTGENGWYDVNVSWDSGTAMIRDIVKQFVSSVW